MECGRGYNWNRRSYLRLDRRVVDLEKLKMYDWIVVGRMCIALYVYMSYMHFSAKSIAMWYKDALKKALNVVG